MKGDLSRDAFEPARHYSSVLLEQGGLLTDSDWKEHADIARHRRERADADIVGHCGGPIDAAAFALSATLQPRALAADAGSPPGIWVAAADGYVLHSTDQGATWNVIDTALTANLNAIRFGGSGGWAAGDRGVVLQSTDLGATWAEVNVGTTTALRSIALAGGQRVWVAGDGGVVAFSVDAGENWERRSLAPVQLNGIAFRDNLNGIVVGHAGAIHTTSDGGLTWQARTSGTNANLFAVAYLNATNAWAVGDDGVIVRSTDGGATWTAQTSSTTARLTAVAFSSATAGVAAGDGGTLLRTTNAGATWGALATGVSAALSGVQLTATEVTAISADGQLVNVPLAGGAATQQQLPPVSLGIGAGRYYVDGTLCEVEAPVSYHNQPDRGPTERLAPGQHLVYLQVWHRHLSALEADGIREVALGDADPSSRVKVIWQVRTLALPEVSPPEWSCISNVPEWTAITAPPSARLTARAEPQQQPTNLCDIGAAAGYRRLENQLYRVEVHEGGAQPRFKWSRENGSIAFAIDSIAAPSGTSPITTTVRLRSRGRDETLDLSAGDRVELLNDDLVLEGRAGPIFEVVGDGDDALEIVLAGSVPAELAAEPSRHPLLRRWDHRPEGAEALDLVEASWIELEDGVQVRFEPNGEYRPGDYWLIPARSIPGDVQWPRDPSGMPLARAPSGVEDHFCRLGLIEVAADGTIQVLSDCRPLFPPLTQLTNLYYVGGDGQEVMPNPQDLQNVPLPAPLQVGVFNGQFPVAGVEVLFTVAQGVLPNGAKTQVVATGGNGVAAINWSLDPVVRNQTATAQLLEGGAPAAGKYNVIAFAASLSVADRVSYDPAKCLELKALGVNNVQSAIDALCARTHRGGCCVTVSEKNEKLDKTLAELIERGDLDICVCLLPGTHTLGDSIDLQRPGLRLSIHGAGRASRLLLDDQNLTFTGLEAIELADFDIIARKGTPRISLIRCTESVLDNMHVSGLTTPGASLVQVSGARRIDLTASQLNAFQKEGIDRAGRVLERVPLLAALKGALEPHEAGLFAPVSDKIAEAFAGMTAAQRKKLGDDIKKLLGQNDPQLQFSTEESEAFAVLQARLAAPDPATMRAALNGLRAAVLLQQGGFALCIADADALTLVADSEINGRLSLYGEAVKDDILSDAHAAELSKAMRTGAITLALSAGDLRLRNNSLRDVRLGDAFAESIAKLVDAGRGTIQGCFRSLIAESNSLTGPQSQFLAFDMALTQNVLRPFTDVGITISTQLKCLGNFAHKEFRLFTIGVTAEAFGNGGLNIVNV